MKNTATRSILTVSASLVILCGTPAVVFNQQISDPNFNTNVARPAYTKKHPKVLFDEAHFNFHTAGGRYKAFADLIAHDGYQITPNKRKFSKDSLKGYDILVIANALGAEAVDDPKAANPAFTDEECDAVRDWVRDGARLLLITDHQPTGAAAENLAKRFGVEMSNSTVMDTSESNHLKGYYEVNLEFRRDNQLLIEHPITQGRDRTERVNRVVTFGGQSLKGPAESTGFLKLGGTAIDILPSKQKVSAAGRFQAIAMKFGRGRVVVTGEAGMLSAQLVAAEEGGTPTSPWGMNFPGVDNRQLALNIMHWLSGLLKQAT
ncbi:MAG TPA: hypothetical protein VGX92_03545 [Pyrinomonadaceae bacterium]|jgi:hypothetical protein|nr:hypothetical protein [Pyrinomonadaceae bacterium]